MSGASRSAQDLWVTRVLGVVLPQAPVGVVGFAKLQLRWRAAQRDAVASLEAFGQAVLGTAEVQDDPRFPLVAQAVKTLPRLVPEFGDELADHLDAATNAGNGEARKPHLQKAITTLASYRLMLAGVPALTQLAEFGKRTLAVEMSAYRELDAALAEIEREVAARAT